jgi:hypothetical protein
MRKNAYLFVITILAFITFSQINSSTFSKTKTPSEILYLSPLPGSKYVTKETNIIIRFKQDLNFASLNLSDFIIEGSLSGIHSYVIIKTNEKNVLILVPDYPFAESENVYVTLPKTIFNQRDEPYEFHFQISDYRLIRDAVPRIPYSNYSGVIPNNFNMLTQDNNRTLTADSIPADFPQITVTRKYDTGPGYIFISNFPFGPQPFSPYLMILNNLGAPVLYKKMPSACFDFKIQNKNTFSYYDRSRFKFFSTNTSFDLIDSFSCGNGYTTDLHELLLLENNHAYLMSYDPQIVNMSQIVTGGDTDAVVTGLIIQELDAHKNVIFQWRSWDHFQITDATHEDMLDSAIDYVHGNAIDIDYDGHVLISSRHLDEITKINRQTGEIIWRLGGKNNQFNFVNDPIQFSHQHCIRRLANGNYLLFDNGNYHNPSFSRACEYKLNINNMTATLVWQYRDNPDTYGFAMGSSQRLPNGNTVIGWGSTSPSICEVRPNGVKVFEMLLQSGFYSYRAFRHTWDGAPPEEMPVSFSLYQNFPNPFNPATTIKYALVENSFVTLKIFDIVGREIKTLISENQPAGTYLVDFNAENLASGVYFYKIVANGLSDSKKMILVK